MSDHVSFMLGNFVRTIFSRDRFLLNYLRIAHRICKNDFINPRYRALSCVRHTSIAQYLVPSVSLPNWIEQWVKPSYVDKAPGRFVPSTIHDKAKSIWLTAYRLAGGKADLWVILRDDARMVTLKNAEKERKRERKGKRESFHRALRRKRHS